MSTEQANKKNNMNELTGAELITATKGMFAKIFLVEDGKAQILVTNDSDDEDGYKVNCQAQINGVRATAGFCYEDDEQKANDCFNNFSQEIAQKMYNEFKSLVV